MNIQEHLFSLGFGKEGTGGNCYAMILHLPCGDQVIVTDTDLNFPTDADELMVGIYDSDGDELDDVETFDVDNHCEALDYIRETIRIAEYHEKGQ